MLSDSYLMWSRLAPTLFWFVLGILLCLLELLFAKKLGRNYKLVPLIIGINSIILSMFLLRANYVPDWNWQIAYWMGLSAVSVIWLRPMFFKSKKSKIQDATEAKTISNILAGKTGKVIYEGAIWHARCNDKTIAIAPDQTVYVLGREGNTLIVAPENLFQL
ncbi:NfeD family protein [Aerosakkonemataceae cyanobacterium BLCC-F154]|uniref:NfeD family protein n=1 Tax=Floridaenema fluviatile BLCC-F154 TaxID=3153640 RepID=A0ABV4YH10_9CYAN